jgi:hypothetical protein
MVAKVVGSNPALTPKIIYTNMSKNIKLKLACLEQWKACYNINQKDVKEESKKTYSNYKVKSNRGPRGKR